MKTEILTREGAIGLIAAFADSGADFASPLRLRDVLRKLFSEHGDMFETMNLTLLAIESLFGDEPMPALPADMTDAERFYAERLNGFRDYVRYFGRPVGVADAGYTGSGEDFLGTGAGVWSPFKLLNFMLMMAIPPRRKIAIVTSVRDEGLGLLEWIAHHRALGITDFFIYTNNNSDGSEHLLEMLAAHHLIRLIYNEVNPDTPIQTKVAEHSLHCLRELRDFEWVFYIDVDEFFIPRNAGYRMEEFWRDIAASLKRSQAAICFNWKWFGSENGYAKEEGLLLERFVHSIHNEHVKSLVRPRDVISMSRVHVPILLPGRVAVRSDFEPMSAMTGKIAPVYDRGQLNHYWNKSFEEFAMKKRRGRISQTLAGAQLDYSVFFSWGENGKRGNFDPPPAPLLERTSQALAELLAIPGLRALQAEIDARFRETIDIIAKAENLRQIFDDHVTGRAISRTQRG